MFTFFMDSICSKGRNNDDFVFQTVLLYLVNLLQTSISNLLNTRKWN